MSPSEEEAIALAWSHSINDTDTYFNRTFVKDSVVDSTPFKKAAYVAIYTGNHEFIRLVKHHCKFYDGFFHKPIPPFSMSLMDYTTRNMKRIHTRKEYEQVIINALNRLRYDIKRYHVLLPLVAFHSQIMISKHDSEYIQDIKGETYQEYCLDKEFMQSMSEILCQVIRINHKDDTYIAKWISHCLCNDSRSLTLLDPCIQDFMMEHQKKIK